MRRPLLLLALAALSSRAEATPNFPPALRAAEALSSEPPCTLCHRGETAAGTVTTPFGRSMRQRGLVMYDVSSLNAALERMRADGVDSDGDGATDLDELAAGGDPNAGAAAPAGGAGPEALALGEPVYGCSAAGGSTSAGAFVALATLAIAARRRRRGRSTAAAADLPFNLNSQGKP